MGPTVQTMVPEHASAPEDLDLSSQAKKAKGRHLLPQCPKRGKLIGQYDRVHYVDDSVRLENVRERYG